MLPLALNQMAVPGRRWDEVLTLAAELRLVGVEFRNDLSRPLFDGQPAERVGARARDLGLRILALAEVKSFNDWTPAKRAEAERLMDMAVACGAEAINLVPSRDGVVAAQARRSAELPATLADLAAMLKERGLTGLVEPLGFPASSLRLKAELVAAIEAANVGHGIRLVHDTFHHALGGDDALFPEHTGLVHISGVADPRLALRDMRDEHRGLIDADDRLGSLDQIARLRAAGCEGPFSFEPFAPALLMISDPAGPLAASTRFITSCLAEMAA